MINKFLLTILCLVVSGFAGGFPVPKYEDIVFLSVGKSQTIFKYRQDAFTDFFKKDLFQGDSLFVFYEQNGIQRLFILDIDGQSTQVDVFQLPRVPIMPLLHPEEYAAKRDSLIKVVSSENCQESFNMSANAKDSIKELHIEEHAYLAYGSDINYNRNPEYSSNVIIGFLQRNGKKHPFYYRKIEKLEDPKYDAIKAYTKVFDFFELFDANVSLPRCK